MEMLLNIIEVFLCKKNETAHFWIIYLHSNALDFDGSVAGGVDAVKDHDNYTQSWKVAVDWDLARLCNFIYTNGASTPIFSS